MDESQALVSVGDAARHLKRSTEQVRRYLREGRLDGRRIGGQWFIDRAALDTFATAAYVMGRDGLAWVARHPGYDALAITWDDAMTWTAGMDRYLLR